MSQKCLELGISTRHPSFFDKSRKEKASNSLASNLASLPTWQISPPPLGKFTKLLEMGFVFTWHILFGVGKSQDLPSWICQTFGDAIYYIIVCFPWCTFFLCNEQVSRKDSIRVGVSHRYLPIYKRDVYLFLVARKIRTCDSWVSYLRFSWLPFPPRISILNHKFLARFSFFFSYEHDKSLFLGWTHLRVQWFSDWHVDVGSTSSVLNQTLSTLTKFVENNTNIYGTK